MVLPHDLDLLLEELVRMTKRFLEIQGEFLPHGAFINSEGKVALVGAQPPGKRPGAQETLKLLEAGLRESAAKNRCRAAGLAIDIRLKNPPRAEDIGKDAIWTTSEQRDGVSVSVYIPYWKSANGQFIYGEPFSVDEAPRIFRLPN